MKYLDPQNILQTPFPTYFKRILKSCRIQKKALYFWVSLLSVCIAAWIIQNSILLSWDVSILLHETKKLLSGGTYVKDYFETSPPMILYLYIPPILAAKFFSMNAISLFRGYVFLLGLFSIALCQLLSKRLFLQRDLIISNLFSLALTALFFIFPLYELGQREHLFFILSMPYILAASLRIKEETLNDYFAILIGLLAGLGFAIKPFFLVTPICIELYVIFSKKNSLACLRPETMTIFMVLCVYTLIAFLIHPDYFHTVVPYAMRLYYSGMNITWSKIILHPVNIFCCFAILFYSSQYKIIFYKELSSVLCFALISFLIIFMMQRFSPFYHLLPHFSLAILLLVFLFSLVVSQQSLEKQQYCLLVILGALYFYFLWHYARIKWFNYFMFPAIAPIVWGFFTFLLAILLILIQRKNLIRLFSSVAIILGISHWFSCTTICMVSNHAFSSTVLFMLLLFMLLAGKTSLNKLVILSLGALGVLIFSYPVYFASDMYFYAMDYKKSVGSIISYMKTHVQQQSIYLFSTESNYIFPVIDYAHVTSVSRFPYFWMLPALVKKTNLAANKTADLQYLKDKHFLIKMIAEDLNYKKPDLVFIDIKKYKANINVTFFNYLTYFGDNHDFQQAWKCYHYLTTLKGESQNLIFNNYNFAIYQRDFCPNNL